MLIRTASPYHSKLSWTSDTHIGPTPLDLLLDYNGDFKNSLALYDLNKLGMPWNSIEKYIFKVAILYHGRNSRKVLPRVLEISRVIGDTNSAVMSSSLQCNITEIDVSTNLYPFALLYTYQIWEQFLT